MLRPMVITMMKKDKSNKRRGNCNPAEKAGEEPVEFRGISYEKER